MLNPYGDRKPGIEIDWRGVAVGLLIGALAWGSVLLALWLLWPMVWR
jgi:hypothetical protein